MPEVFTSHGFTNSFGGDALDDDSPGGVLVDLPTETIGILPDDQLPESLLTAQSTGRRTFDGITKAGGLDLSVGAGTGVFKEGPPTGASPSDIAFVAWNATTLSIPADSLRTVVVDDTGTVSSVAGLAPDPEQFIILGAVRTDATDVTFLSVYDNDLIQTIPDRFKYVRDAIGVAVVSGAEVSSLPSLQFEISTGVYYISEDRKQLASAISPATFTYWYRDGSGGWNTVSSQTALDPDNYDDGSGTLASIPTGFYKKDHVFITPVSNTAVDVHVVYGQVVLDNESVTNATEVVIPPDGFNDFATELAGIVVQEGATEIASVADERRIQAAFLGGNGRLPFSKIETKQEIFFKFRTKGPTNDVSFGDVDGFEMPNDGSNNKGGQVAVLIPRSARLETDFFIRFDLITFTAGTGDGDIRLQMEVSYVSEGELVNKGADETIQITEPVVNTEGARHRVIQSLDHTLVKSTDAIIVGIQRLTNNAADTFDGTVMLGDYGEMELGVV